MGKAILNNPYVPILRSTPARITLTAVGASTWASGNHVWNGKIGTLIANPMKSAIYARYLHEVFRPKRIVPGSKFAWFIIAIMLNVWIFSPDTGSVTATLKYKAI